MPAAGVPESLQEKAEGGRGMSFLDLLPAMLGRFISTSPALILWGVVLVFGIVILRRGGDKAEKFIIAGAGIKLMGNILGIPASFIRVWEIIQDRAAVETFSVFETSAIISLNILSMFGFLCLIYALWLKCMEKIKTGQESAEYLDGQLVEDG